MCVFVCEYVCVVRVYVMCIYVCVCNVQPLITAYAFIYI